MKKSSRFSLLFCTLIFSACQNPVQQAVINEGTITYKVTYPEINPKKNNSSLPSETKFVFKGNKAGFFTSARGVIFFVNLLANDQKKYTNYLINTFGENYAFTESQEDITKQENNPEYQIETTNDKKIIAGLECKKATVNDKTNKIKFDIYYYEKIKMKLGNCPYKDFDYLLMEYQDTRYGLPMKLTASKLDLKAIDTSWLNIRGKYNWVDRNAFLRVLEDLKK